MDATTWKAWLSAPGKLWVSLLVANTVMYVLPSQASPAGIAPLEDNQVQGAIATSSAQQSAASIDVSADMLGFGNVTAVAKPTSDKGSLETNNAQDPIATSSAPQTADSVDAALTASPVGKATSVAELTSNKRNIDTNTVQGTVAVPSTTTSKIAPIEVSTQAPTPSDVPSVTELTSSEADSDADNPMSQITNVTQLRDVSPGDWAFEALRSLVERYGCIAGYPDRTYRGNRATSRYEFAAGLNACLQQIERLIASSTTDFVKRQDLETLQRLVNEFKTELATLGTRVDKLEGRVAFLEDHQFSTTTKLNGLAWFNVTGAFADGDVLVETTDLNGINGDLALRQAGRDPVTNRPIVRTVTKNPSITLSNLVWLTFNTSFTGKDTLVTQLAAGNGNSPANAFASAGFYNTYGVPFLDQTAGTQTGINNVIVRDLFYQFPVTNSIQVVIGPRVNWYRFFDNNAYNFFLTGTSTFNSNGSTLLNSVDRGSGAVVLWDINKLFKLRFGYLGESDEFLPSPLFNSASNPGQGLFNGTNSLTAELTFSPIDTLNLRFLYNRTNTQQIFGQVGGPASEPLAGLADDGFGGPLRSASADTFSVNFDWRVASFLGLFGRYSYGSTHLTPVNPARAGGDVNIQALQLGLAFPDLGKEGAMLTLSYLRPFALLDGRNFLVSGGGDGGVQYEFEATYYYPITNNIAIVPAFYYIANPNNFSANPSIYIGNVRAQFSF
ncbi:MAG TPA: iron uptake porin [Coleofasciculaceae cyanobacterium]|jgi:BMFP domain-containing protein YqiC